MRLLVLVGDAAQFSARVILEAVRPPYELRETLRQLFEIAREQGLPTYRAADRLAERRIDQVSKLKRTWI